jgi:hypothetical protein
MRVQPVVGSFYQAEKADKNIPTTTGHIWSNDTRSTDTKGANTASYFGFSKR